MLRGQSHKEILCEHCFAESLLKYNTEIQASEKLWCLDNSLNMAYIICVLRVASPDVEAGKILIPFPLVLCILYFMFPDVSSTLL